MDLKDIGWRAYAGDAAPPENGGRVALVTREQFVVWTPAGEVEASVSGQLRHRRAEWPCVGDWVVLDGGNVIESVLPRRTELARKEPGKGTRAQVLAANLDVLFIISGLDRDYNPRRLERYLVLAYQAGVRPVIVLNKVDLASDMEGVVGRTKEWAQAVPVLATCAVTGWGSEALRSEVGAGETAALIGSSGAGKSTLVNCFLGEERQQTGMVRAFNGKGRHTTTQRELFRMRVGGC